MHQQLAPGWRLRLKVKGEKEPFVDFLRKVVCSMFAHHGSPSIKQMSASNSNMDISWDKHHWPQHTPTDSKGQWRRLNCRYCWMVEKKEKKAIYECDKCKVALHITCFKVIIDYFADLYRVSTLLII